MSDLGFIWGEYDADLGIAANDLAIDDGLETAIIISLFSDRYAEDYDVIPEGEADRRGWWGDSLPIAANDRIGSRLWLLSREKQVPEVLVRAKEYAEQALEWLIEDRICESYQVTTEYIRPGFLAIGIVINRPDRTKASYRYSYAWTAQEARRG